MGFSLGGVVGDIGGFAEDIGGDVFGGFNGVASEAAGLGGSFLDPFWDAGIAAAGSVLGTGAAQWGTNAIFGDDPFNQKLTKKDIRMGHDEDTRSYKERDQYDWRKAKKRGLTPQEFYGSPAAGGSASSGGAQTLGNNSTVLSAKQNQLASDAAQRSLDRQASIEKTKISADAQVKSAELSSGASRYSTDTQATIAANRLSLDRDTYKNVNLPTAAANIGKTEKETEKLINEIATSDKHFVLYMKKLSMGVDNMLSEMYQSMNNFDVTKPSSLKKFSPQERQALLGGMIALQSQSYKEATGLAKGIGDPLMSLWELIKANTGGLEGTGESKALGNGVENSFRPPSSYKKPGVPGPQPYKTF